MPTGESLTSDPVAWNLVADTLARICELGIEKVNADVIRETLAAVPRERTTESEQEALRVLIHLYLNLWDPGDRKDV